MEVKVDQDLCIACGLCISHCPEVFDWNAEEKADAKQNPVPPEAVDCCHEAVQDCPTQAISES